MTTNYISITSDCRTIGDMDHNGTSSTSTDILELRFGTSTYNPTIMEVMAGLLKMQRWLEQRGLDGNGTGVPVNAG